MEKKQQNHLLYLIIAIIVIVLITILVIVAINNKNGGLTHSDNIPPEESKFEVTSGDIETYDSFIKVKRIMNKVVSYIKEAKEGKTNNFYNCLDKQYISEEEITETDLKDSLKNFNNDFFKTANVSYEQIAKDMILYDVDSNIGETYIKVQYKNDSDEAYFTIMPKRVKNENNLTNNIDEKEVNQTNFSNASDKEIISEVYTNYIYKCIDDSGIAYGMLDTTYVKTRFKTINEFENYLNGMKADITNEITDYTKLVNTDFDEYIMYDSLWNVFVFDIRGYNDYSVMLDSYTKGNTAKGEYYTNLSIDAKARYNLKEFFQAINTMDYNTAYYHIMSDAKTNAFPTQEVFENFIKGNMYKHNILKINNTIKNEGNIYQFDVTVSNQSNTNENKNYRVIVQIGTENGADDYAISISLA